MELQFAYLKIAKLHTLMTYKYISWHKNHLKLDVWEHKRRTHDNSVVFLSFCSASRKKMCECRRKTFWKLKIVKSAPSVKLKSHAASSGKWPLHHSVYRRKRGGHREKHQDRKRIRNFAALLSDIVGWVPTDTPFAACHMTAQSPRTKCNVCKNVGR